MFYKLLIPNSEFRPGGDPMGHLVKGWTFRNLGTNTDAGLRERWADGKPKPISDYQINSLNQSWIVVPPDDAEQLMSARIDANGQTFRCKGLVFTHRWSDEDKVEYANRFETRVSPDTPFSLVAADWTRTTFDGGQAIDTSTHMTILLSSGDDAVSSLPDIK